MRLGMMTIGMSAMLFGVGLAGFTGQQASAGVAVEYVASTGVAPAGPSWSLSNGGAMTNDGTVLKQNAASGAASAYTSAATAGLMVKNTSDYSLEFVVKVVADTPATDWFSNDIIAWSDDAAQYGLTLVKNADGPGTGGLKTGSGTTIGGLTKNVVTGVDWSTSHKFVVAYTGSSNTFNVYVDDVLVNTQASTYLQLAASPEPAWQNRVMFGDNLTGGGGATAIDWSVMRLHDVALAPAAVPEPATLTTGAAVAGAMFLRRRRR